ncbi:hypothetical protein BJV77DRAFT_713728 [Russula vinacea]|nr:hypothetical protein BJV77DRAFT_713728 [Russula vinacea]
MRCVALATFSPSASASICLSSQPLPYQRLMVQYDVMLMRESPCQRVLKWTMTSDITLRISSRPAHVRSHTRYTATYCYSHYEFDTLFSVIAT